VISVTTYQMTGPAISGALSHAGTRRPTNCSFQASGWPRTAGRPASAGGSHGSRRRACNCRTYAGRSRHAATAVHSTPIPPQHTAASRSRRNSSPASSVMYATRSGSSGSNPWTHPGSTAAHAAP
jgi:hypothetical protein